MNNIYKVIWSKAKNCYVVASEIARSHTKSATGSEKIGGVTRRSLLASLMALSLLCGGLGVAEASVHVNEVPDGTKEVYTIGETYNRTEVDLALAAKGAASDVASNRTDIDILKTAVGGPGSGLTKDVADQKADIATNRANINNLDGKLANLTTAVDGKANEADVNAQLANKADKTALDNKANKATTLDGYGITDAYTKTDANDKFATSDALNTAKTDLEGKITTAENELDGKITANTTKINANETAIQKLNAKAGTTETTLNDLSDRMVVAENNITDLKDADVRLEGKIDQNANDINGLKDKDVELSGKINDNKNLIDQNKTNIAKNAADITNINGKLTTAEGNIQTNTDNINALDKKVGTINNGTYLDGTASVADNLGKLDAGLKQEVEDRKAADTALSGRIDANANTIAKVNTELRNTNAALQATNKRTAGIGRTDTGVEAGNQTVIEDTVYFDQNGNVSGVKDLQTDTIHATGEITSKGLNAGDGEIKTTGKVSAGDVSTGTLETTGNATIGGKLDVKGTLNTKDVAAETIHISKSENNPDYKSEGSIIGEGGKLSVSNEKFDKRNNITEKSELNVNEKGTVNWATSTDATGNVTEGRSEVTADNIKNSVKKTEGGKTFGYEENITAGGKGGTVTDKAGNTTYTKVTATENSFQVQDKDGKNKNHQVNTKDSSVTEITNGDGKTTKTEQTATDIINTAKDGTITNDANHIVNKANTMDTTVTGKATESYGELETTVNGKETHTVTGNQDIHVTGKQTNTVGGGQENIISGGQTNTITGGQINNITGDQTTTITGNKTETVTENVTEDYKKNLTTTVGGNEIHEVKGTKTETVEGKLTENFKGGQETNVTGDQTTNVSGTQTTTATDINRNASSGMIDTIDNDYGTNTETKVAGKTTTDVSIKGTEEKGQYIRGANESRDYLIKGTLKNSETKTVEKTSTEITDGKGKTSATIQDVNNLAGSVTNGTETGVSGIHANDNSVSIDSIVTDGNKYSVINQKKGSIQSTVVDGTNSTVILQDKDNVTIASSNGMVGLVGKDIVNNAQNTITNTAGTSITNQVKDSKVTTDANGTTFENNTPAVSDVGTTTTKINGNQITTGRVDANELGVSDVDGANTADFSVKAGEGVKASAGDGTTTGSLDVTAKEVGSSVKDDASGKGSTFKQRIDAIMGNVKTDAGESEVTQKGDEITSVVGKGEATNSRVTQKKGSLEAAVTDGTNTNVSYDVANASAKELTDGTNTSVQNQTASLIATGVKDGAGNENASAATATSSANTIKSGSKANTVISTADGTRFINSEAAAPVTGASGAGTAVDTTIKGNTITTGKVTMDYAEVMRDLGVNGNANINGKTTTGSLEVKGESKLTGKVTMVSDATVGGKLDVTGKATFQNDVDITGNVKANSYKVGDKTYIDADGIHANNQKITDVADGSISEGSKDAVNGGQLYNVKNDLEGKVNKVGANAAAMANLHPMEFDPDSKWNIAAAIGNYGSETAAALGAFYRPNDDVMVNLSTAFGTGENMVGGGVSVRLGKGSNKLSREESNALKAQVNDLTARMDALLSVLNPNMSKDFPDVPENHWAYEAVSRLAGNDIVQGYPDGEFHGERTMTRYEMAEIIYNALSRGAEAERELVEEFKPELQAMAASEKATAERAEG